MPWTMALVHFCRRVAFNWCTEEYNAEGPIELSKKADFMNMGMGQHL